jgi:hypothetical protein
VAYPRKGLSGGDEELTKAAKLESPGRSVGLPVHPRGSKNPSWIWSAGAGVEVPSPAISRGSANVVIFD